jgi:hypothetical protein
LIGASCWIHSNCQPWLAKQLGLRYGVGGRPTSRARFNQPFSFLIDILIFLLFNNVIIRKRRFIASLKVTALTLHCNKIHGSLAMYASKLRCG